MGRIKTRFVKTSADRIYDSGKDEFTDNFEKNKAIIEKYAQIPSKRMRNSINGYITRMKKRSLKEEEEEK